MKTTAVAALEITEFTMVSLALGAPKAGSPCSNNGLVSVGCGRSLEVFFDQPFFQHLLKHDGAANAKGKACQGRDHVAMRNLHGGLMMRPMPAC